MHIQTDRAFVPSGTPDVRYLHITVNAPAGKAAEADSRPPASIGFALDRSGSMDGEKIVMAREAVAHAVKLLKPKDHLAIVCYDEEITTVIERTPASQEAKTLALKRLAEVEARGATDLHGGWTRGAALVSAEKAGSDSVSKVLLLTDGLANRGVVDREELLAESRRMRNAGVLTSTFGVGRDFDEDLLSRLATEGGGHFYFIERPAQIPDFLASELGETLEIVAREVELEIASDPGVEATLLTELPADWDANRIRIKLGNLVSDQEMSIVVGVVFRGAQAEGTSLGVECRLRDRDGVMALPSMRVVWEAVSAARNSHQAVNGDVMFAAATVIAERARRAALAANAARDFEEAKRILQRVLNDLQEFARHDSRVIELIHTLRRDAEGLSEAMDPMARKAKHFASHLVAYSRAAGGTARRRKTEP